MWSLIFGNRGIEEPPPKRKSVISEGGKPNNKLTETFVIGEYEYGNVPVPATREYVNQGKREGWLEYAGAVRDSNGVLVHTYMLLAPKI